MYFLLQTPKTSFLKSVPQHKHVCKGQILRNFNAIVKHCPKAPLAGMSNVLEIALPKIPQLFFVSAIDAFQLNKM